MKLVYLLICSFLLSATLCGCNSKTDTVSGAENTEMVQQLGDVMASIDEVGGTAGTIATLSPSIKKTFARLSPGDSQQNYFLEKFLLPQAFAVTCDEGTGGYQAGCTAVGGGIYTKTRTFSSCSVGGGVLYSGTVLLTWTGTGINGCALTQIGNMVLRTPTYTVQGRRGATLTVSKAATNGQQLLWISGSGSSKIFNYSNDGIRRKFTNSSGVTTYEHVTTATGVNITGADRIINPGPSQSNRTLSGGVIKVKDVLADVTCDFVSTNVIWKLSTCNCPTEGSFSASCKKGTDGDVYTTSLVLNGCGTAKYTEGSTTNDVLFDRCGS